MKNFIRKTLKLSGRKKKKKEKKKQKVSRQIRNLLTAFAFTLKKEFAPLKAMKPFIPLNATMLIAVGEQRENKKTKF